MAKRRGIGDLFIFKRRPRWNVPREWEAPADDAGYQALLREHDFITEAELGEYLARVQPRSDVGKPLTAADFATVRADLAFLHQADYMGELFRNSQAASHSQNLYYRYNWLFGIFAVITTLATVLSLSTADYEPGAPPRILSAILAATMGALTTFIGTRMRALQPQHRWYSARRRTEALRSHYFLFFAHARPYRGSDYQRRNRLYVSAAHIDTLGKSGSSTAEVQTVAVGDERTRSEHRPWETDFIKAMYIQHRYDRQMAWYEERIGEFEDNSSFAALVSGILLAVTAIISAFSVLVTGEALQILVTVIPSAAATFMSAQQIYGWDRQVSLYEDTRSRLKDLRGRLKLDNPDIENEREVADAIAACEQVFAGESDQWGQDVLRSPLLDSRTALLDQLDDTLEQIRLPEPVKQRIRQMAEAAENGGRPADLPPNAPPPVSDPAQPPTRP